MLGREEKATADGELSLEEEEEERKSDGETAVVAAVDVRAAEVGEQPKIPSP